MATKDVTKEKQAKTVEDVNNQDARTRLWQSLNTTYSNQMDESDKAYDKSISQQNNAMLARGMGRSSYASQIAANMYTEKNNARNRLGEALIADYQNRISDIENQEKEDERWERQFAETQKQNEWQRQYQEGEAARQQSNWEKEYAANRSDTAWSQGFQQSQLDYQKSQDALAQQNWETQFAYQQQRDAAADQQWQKQYDEQLRQFNENMAYQRERANVSDAQWQKQYDESLREFNAQMAQQEAQFKANYDFQVSEANRQQSNWEIQQAFNEQQWQAQQEQWKQEFEYNKMSDSQKIAYNYIVAAASNGGDVSDALLKQAGISRTDYNAMKAKATGGNPNPKPDPKDEVKAVLTDKNLETLVNFKPSTTTKNHTDIMLSTNALLNSATGTVRAMTEADKKKTNSGT
ncbi:MAG: hypothetical protein J6Y48_11695 [Clostridia bacterium]|nr:hypothetical protein [Clostridia bacterium]